MHHLFSLSHNLHRRHLTPSQLAMVGARARDIYDRQAKERQKLSKGRGEKGPVNLPDLKPERGDSRDQVGKVVKKGTPEHFESLENIESLESQL